jgi:hypothetical protein
LPTTRPSFWATKFTFLTRDFWYMAQFFYNSAVLKRN